MNGLLIVTLSIFSWDRTNYFNIEKWHPSALRSSVFGEGSSLQHECKAKLVLRRTAPVISAVPQPNYSEQTSQNPHVWLCHGLPPHKWALWISGGEATVNPHCCADLDLNAGQINCHLRIIAGEPGQWIRICANLRWEDGFRCTCAESRDPKARVYAN